jgi:predicted MFS family arabinose efflux permease
MIGADKGGMNMQNNKGKIGLTAMAVFITMNFAMSMSGTLFNGILDKIAADLRISVAQTGYLTSLYAYGAIGTPVILIVLRKMSRSRLLKAMLFLNIVFGALSICTDHFTVLLFARFMLGLAGTTYGILTTTTIASLSEEKEVGKNLSLLIAGAAAALMAGVPLCRVLIRYFSWQDDLMHGFRTSVFYVLFAENPAIRGCDPLSLGTGDDKREKCISSHIEFFDRVHRLWSAVHVYHTIYRGAFSFT